jgi:hypothetical protein
LDLTTQDEQAGWLVLERLLKVAQQDTGQARRVANFLLAWHNAEENGGWDPVDLWNVDAAIADDMLTVTRLIRESHRYPRCFGVQRRDCGPSGGCGEGENSRAGTDRAPMKQGKEIIPRASHNSLQSVIVGSERLVSRKCTFYPVEPLE